MNLYALDDLTAPKEEKLYSVSIEVLEDHMMYWQGQTIDETISATGEEDALQRVMRLHELKEDKIRVQHNGLWRG